MLIASRNKWVAAALMFGVFGAIQGLIEVFRFAPKLFSQQQLSEYPWITAFEHHLLQLLLTLVALGILSRGRFSEWGLNLRNHRRSLAGLLVFVPIYSLIILGWNVLPFILQNRAPEFSYALTTANVVGWLVYMGIFVGPSEELLFRGMIHTYLSKSWTGSLIVARVSIPWAGIPATVIFCLAHIDSVHINWAQQLFAFGLGIYYSTMYQRTGSLLNPILAHNYSDAVISAAGYATYFWLR